MSEERRRRVNELFHAALEHESATRQSYLEIACGGDIELRQQIELLLAKQQEACSFLETPAIGYVTLTRTVTVNPPPRQFGAYRIVSLLGAGGMGEVYRAHDSKLGRDVALKFLPAEFARDPERLARFRREARTLASLNHPHIGAIYGLEECGGMDSLVLELVEGDTLRGPLPVAQALEYARQVAEALEAAHAKGIIHRDLKPSNIKITPQSQVKVLDFGLAKAILGPDQSPAVSSSTGAEMVTFAGHIVGTPGYMAPEQATGSKVDPRTDIWAFGCLLYELLTGKRAFGGETLPEAKAAVLEREPDWQALPARTPPKIRELLRHCLQKEPDRRLALISDARRTIEAVRQGQNRWRAAAIAIAAVAVVGVCSALWLRGPARRPVDRSQWVQLTKFPDSVSQPALSPDGHTLAFIRGNGTFMTAGQIYVKQLPDGEPVQLTHDDLPKMSPAFSPDGARIAYTTLNPPWSWDTAVVPVTGGAPQPFLRNASGLVWTGPRQVLFSEIKTGAHMGLVTAEESRMGVRDIYIPTDEPAMAHRSYISPDHKSVLLVEMDQDHLWLPCRIVPADGSSSGYRVGPPGGCTFAAWSPDGKWMYFTANSGGTDHIWRQHFPDGQPEQITSGPTEEQGIAIAPDGRSLVTAVALQNTSLWIHDSRGERQISLEGNAANPRFTPDGKKLCYLVVKEAPNAWVFYRDPGELRIADIESGYSEPLVPELQVLDYDISRDGRQLVLWTADRRIWLVPFDRSSPPREIKGVKGGHPRFSPDGDIFFRREEGHSTFVYRVHPDGSGLRKAFDQPVLILYDVSRDGRWVVGWGPVNGTGTPTHQAYGLDGRTPSLLGPTTWLSWSLDGRATFIVGRWTFVISRPPDEILRQIPAGGFHSAEEIARLPGAHPIEGAVNLVPGPVGDVYVFYRVTIQRNLYRIPIL